MRTVYWIPCALVVAGIALAGCSRTVVKQDSPPDVIVVESDRPGPPAHAPAHGQRRKHAGDDVVLVYSPTLQVYVVENHSDCYYSAGQYFRPGKKAWEWSVDVQGPWRVLALESDLPPGLRKVDVSVHQKKEKKGKD